MGDIIWDTSGWWRQKADEQPHDDPSRRRIVHSAVFTTLKIALPSTRWLLGV